MFPFYISNIISASTMVVICYKSLTTNKMVIIFYDNLQSNILCYQFHKIDILKMA